MTEQTIRVGEGRFGPIAFTVWNFEVSGLKVVQSWLSYRMKQAVWQEIFAAWTTSGPNAGRRV